MAILTRGTKYLCASKKFCYSRDQESIPILPDEACHLNEEKVNLVNPSFGETCDHLLPEPEWGSEPECLEFSSLVTFQFFLQELRNILEAELESHSYNTVGSFLAFYEAFLEQGRSFEEFYKGYRPSILPESLSCVGLGCALVESMKLSLGYCYPVLKSSLFIASCEEMILDMDSYTSCSPPSSSYSVKEHVLVVLKVKVEEREGYIVMDPGYHVNIPVIVMADGLYPSTGWFLLSETTKSKKEYNYFVEGSYIKWDVKETRGGNVNSWTNLVYVGRKFLSFIDVSEKRNLVFNFRTIVARDKKKPIAGLYCNLEGEEKFTFFFSDQSYQRRDVKIPFEYFQSKRENNQFECAISSCANQIGYNESLLSDIMNRIIEAYFNSDFMPFVRLINRKIDE